VRADNALPSDTDGQRVARCDDIGRSQVPADGSVNSCEVEMLDVRAASSPASADSEKRGTRIVPV